MGKWCVRWAVDTGLGIFGCWTVGHLTGSVHWLTQTASCTSGGFTVPRIPGNAAGTRPLSLSGARGTYPFARDFNGRGREGSELCTDPSASSFWLFALVCKGVHAIGT